MAKLPDGLIFLFEADRKSVSIEMKSKELIKCRHCKFYVVKEHWWESDGVPILCADCCPTCTKWGDGCMTNPDGYCFLAERREDDG